jgi:siderophore synthetase component
MEPTIAFMPAHGVSCETVYERLKCQTLEALFFEEIIPVTKNGQDYSFRGRNARGETVLYTCEVVEKWSFGRVKVKPYSIKRDGDANVSIYTFFEEVVQLTLEGQYTATFVQELLETFVKDSQAKSMQPISIPKEDLHYEALESHMIDGHPYHPSYKSRLGFTLEDNYLYGPEFNQNIVLYWLAVHRNLVDIAVLGTTAVNEMYRHHLQPEELAKFKQHLREQIEEDEEAYFFLPVHPWQYEHIVSTVFFPQIADKTIIVLGKSASLYRAQQSIRSLSNRHCTQASYLKLSLNITNTSTSRILAHHTTQNAPIISAWLDKIIKNDEYLKTLRFEILKEIIGVSFRYHKLSAIQYTVAYGTLGVIHRENIAHYLEEGEQAWPLNALTHKQKNGVAFIQQAITLYGVEKWSKALIQVLVTPIIHLLYVQGIALESHAQNIILVLKNNFPHRIIVKDLHDGVRFCSEDLLHPEWEPQLNPEPATHREFNRYSFLKASQASEVRDYTFDAFFFICMTELCFTLEEFGLSEEEFWRTCVEVILTYQQQHPQYKERFQIFNLFAEDALIEEMTKRRIYGDQTLYFRKAQNPLLRAMALLKNEEK